MIKAPELLKTVVITGASTGIGLASVKACISAGYQVIATARKEDDLKHLEQLGAIAVFLELSDKESVRIAANEILVKANHDIHTLFNNAGYGLQVAMEDATWEGLSQQHITNVIGPIELTNHLLGALKPGSKLIFNSSILGLLSSSFRGPYAMSKYAIEAAADSYRLELESLGVSVHLLEPGPIEANFRATASSMINKTLGDKKTRLDYTKHKERLDQVEFTKGTLPAESCSEIIVDIADGKKQKARYLVTNLAKIAAILKRLLGSRFDVLAKNSDPVQLRSEVK